MGNPKRPSYRIVVTDSRNPRDGAYITAVGHYDPMTEPEQVVINEDEVLRWLGQGAQPTTTVARLLNKAGVMNKLKTKRS